MSHLAILRCKPMSVSKELRTTKKEHVKTQRKSGNSCRVEKHAATNKSLVPANEDVAGGELADASDPKSSTLPGDVVLDGAAIGTFQPDIRKTAGRTAIE